MYLPGLGELWKAQILNNNSLKTGKETTAQSAKQLRTLPKVMGLLLPEIRWQSFKAYPGGSNDEIIISPLFYAGLASDPKWAKES